MDLKLRKYSLNLKYYNDKIYVGKVITTHVWYIKILKDGKRCIWL